ncbi:RNA polymerase sigma factor [Actinocorallia longicatena]|uniref:Sigma-70 family RNA polymerase sigma factor n=1 Tax=Actinocorallia longicatena TaxID=111803 RepID=A0ABP6QND8_9ACTN
MKAALEEAFRTERGRIVATLIRLTGDWDLAEECAQDAFARALGAWPRDGVPLRPGAWLTTTARNLALDRLRRGTVEAARLRDHSVTTAAVTAAAEPHARLEEDAQREEDDVVPDDRLLLIFTCCHPALSMEARVALTLRTLAGLTTAEIARAFLVPEAVMGQRIVRAKRKIRNAGIPYRIPPARLLPERTTAVLAVLYLLFNEGYSAGSGPEPTRPGLTAEAIRLARVLADLMPGEPEARGLLALMLLHDSRREARIDDAGDLVTLEAQDRSRWDRAAIDEALALLDADPPERPGPYLLQAAISACHAVAAEPADTDWRSIALLYRRLSALNPSPVIELNRAVAVAMAEGPEAGLALLPPLEPRLPGYHLLPAARADLLRRLGRHAEAALAYESALALAPTDAERRFLRRRATAASAQAAPPSSEGREEGGGPVAITAGGGMEVVSGELAGPGGAEAPGDRGHGEGAAVGGRVDGGVDPGDVAAQG